MNFLALAILLLFVLNIDGIYAQNIENDLTNPSISNEEIRSSSSSKIHSILIKWQTSENPNEFAKENNLSYTENKIGVYIHLDSVESQSKIPQDIQVTAFNEKIIVAFVSSEQLDTLEELDFVKRVTPPDLARTPPIPKVVIPEIIPQEENRYDYLLLSVIGSIVIITIIIFKKRKKLKD